MINLYKQNATKISIVHASSCPINRNNKGSKRGTAPDKYLASQSNKQTTNTEWLKKQDFNLAD